MEKEQAINILAKEDIDNIINKIKTNNLTVIYWNNNYVDNESDKWLINENNMCVFLSHSMNLNLHWTKLIKPLTDKIKKDNIHITKEYLFLDK